MYSTTKTTRGFTFVETLTYGTGIIIILGGIVAFLFYLYTWYRSATIPTRVDAAALTLMNQIATDIRVGNTLNDSGSIYNSANGQVSVTTSSGANSTTTIYYLENGKIRSKIGSNATTTVSAGDIWISGFYVKKLSTPNSMAVRLELNLDYFLNKATTTNTYTDLAILRQSY